jgi:hypothetical protein
MAAVIKEPSSYLGGGPGAVFSPGRVRADRRRGGDHAAGLACAGVRAAGRLTHSARPAPRPAATQRPRHHRSRDPGRHLQGRQRAHRVRHRPVSAAASATNQNAWIAYMKQELKKYPKISLASVVYGNDDRPPPTRSPRACCSSTRTSRASSRRPVSASRWPPRSSTHPSTAARSC